MFYVAAGIQADHYLYSYLQAITLPSKKTYTQELSKIKLYFRSHNAEYTLNNNKKKYITLFIITPVLFTRRQIYTNVGSLFMFIIIKTWPPLNGGIVIYLGHFRSQAGGNKVKGFLNLILIIFA